MSENGGGSDTASFEITDLTDDYLPEALAALQETFDRQLDERWFEWKHRAGPWGSSPGWVAFDAEGLIGVRLFLPWRFRDGHREYRAFRPCDTVTVPRARGRGVFRKLTEHAISRLGDNVDFLFNTPNEQSKPGYLTMGFVEWTHVQNRLGGVTPHRAKLIEDVTLTTLGPALATSRTAEYLDWRYRHCPIKDYQVLALSESDAPNGIVAGLRNWRGMRLMVVEECWGGHAQERTLVRAAAKRSEPSSFGSRKP